MTMALDRTQASARRGASLPLGAVARHGLLMLAAFVFAAPFFWMVLTSLKSAATIGAAAPLFSGLDSGGANYMAALTATPLLRYLANGSLIAIAILVLQLAIALPAAYALARYRLRQAPLLDVLLVIALAVPVQATAIPVFIAFANLGLIDSWWAVILPHIGSAFAILLFRAAFLAVPMEVIEAARLDGRSELGIVWAVMIPFAFPAIIAFSLLSFMASWNEYFWPLIVLNSPEKFTPPLGIVAFRRAEAGIEYGPLMAAATIVVLPLLALALAAHRRLAGGLTFRVGRDGA